MKFLAVSLHDYNSNKRENGYLKCRTVTVTARSLELAKEIIRLHHPRTSWFLARCDTPKNMVYSHETM